MKNLIAGITLLIVIIVLSGCPKPCIEANYSFAVNSQIIPDSDSIKLGDTIFLYSSFPTTLKDQSTGQVINYNNSTGLGSTLGLVELVDGTYPGIDAVNDFDYISIFGMVYNDKSIPSPNKFQQLKYEQINGNYELKIGIIPKKSGTYYLGLGDGLSNGRSKNKSCEKASFNTTFKKTNQHLNYFSEWSSNATLSAYEQSHAYFFKVY